MHTMARNQANIRTSEAKDVGLELFYLFHIFVRLTLQPQLTLYEYHLRN